MARRDAEILAAARRRDLSAVIAERHVIVCTGSGGVGKTTTAAATALAAAEQGRRTIVLTIDPARRLAQSLGLTTLDNVARRVRGVDRLDAMMLDMKRTFDDVVDRHAPDPGRARRIHSNRFYQQLSGSLAGTHEYMAMEKLYDLHTTGTYDCIVIDTPPTRSALDFLDAPKRLTDFLEGRFLRMFLAPTMTAGKLASRAVGFGTGLFMKAASRITGSQVLDDLAEFFVAFEGMYEGFKNRATAVYRLLGSPSSAFVVVTTAQPGALREARFFLQRLAQDGMPTAGLVVNRLTPSPSAALAATSGDELVAAADRIDEPAIAGLLRIAADDQRAAQREQRATAAALHGVDPEVLVEIPELGGDVSDIDGLGRIGAFLYGARDLAVP